MFSHPLYALLFASALLFPTVAFADTCVVVNTNDSGVGSLRQAMLDVETTPGFDFITFEIPGPAPHTIALQSPLPVMTVEVTIDATSNPDYVFGTPVIELDGKAISSTGSTCIDIEVSNSTIAGLIINRYPGDAVLINADNCSVYGCWIGVNSAGTAGSGNAATSHGIRVFGAFNQIGAGIELPRNVICLGLEGIRLEGPDAILNSIQGNWIGILPDASIAAFGPSANGIYLLDGAIENTIGGDASQGNVICGCGFTAINLFSTPGSPTPCDYNSIQGNRIGTNPTATATIPNARGVSLFDVQYNAVAENLIAGISNAGSGVALTGEDCYSNSVATNTFGVDATGNAPLGTNYVGVELSQNANNNSITDNVISNGQFGVTLTLGAWSNSIYGNTIGLGMDRTTPLGNLAAGIVTADASTTGNVIGYPQVEHQNFISANGIGIVLSPPGSVNSLRQNRIYGNTDLGIDRSDLVTFGITPNDLNDEDGIQNYPVITSVTRTDATHVTIAGTINTLPNTYVRLEFFANSVADSSGAGEGEKLCLGALDQDNFVVSNLAMTDASGNASFSFDLTVESISASDSISGTAETEELGTSEFSTVALAPVTLSGFELE